mmetsp:Transcript_15081/g.46933  ORF Transcript_15081/g.46933 Transcript_15081/m.46933 type:complete len:205 (-) Transcript_15081:6-620(-)
MEVRLVVLVHDAFARGDGVLGLGLREHAHEGRDAGDPADAAAALLQAGVDLLDECVPCVGADAMCGAHRGKAAVLFRDPPPEAVRPVHDGAPWRRVEHAGARVAAGQKPADAAPLHERRRRAGRGRLCTLVHHAWDAGAAVLGCAVLELAQIVRLGEQARQARHAAPEGLRGGLRVEGHRRATARSASKSSRGRVRRGGGGEWV